MHLLYGRAQILQPPGPSEATRLNRGLTGESARFAPPRAKVSSALFRADEKQTRRWDSPAIFSPLLPAQEADGAL